MEAQILMRQVLTILEEELEKNKPAQGTYILTDKLLDYLSVRAKVKGKANFRIGFMKSTVELMHRKYLRFSKLLGIKGVSWDRRTNTLYASESLWHEHDPTSRVTPFQELMCYYRDRKGEANYDLMVSVFSRLIVP